MFRFDFQTLGQVFRDATFLHDIRFMVSFKWVLSQSFKICEKPFSLGWYCLFIIWNSQNAQEDSGTREICGLIPRAYLVESLCSSMLGSPSGTPWTPGARTPTSLEPQDPTDQLRPPISLEVAKGVWGNLICPWELLILKYPDFQLAIPFLNEVHSRNIVLVCKETFKGLSIPTYFFLQWQNGNKLTCPEC